MSSSLAKVDATTPIKQPSFETRFAKLTAEEYFSEPCAVPALSSSIAHVLNEQSPIHAWTQHAAFGGVKRGPTKALDAGSLIHTLLLDAGKDVEIIKADDYRTNAAKASRDAARAAKRIPVLEKDYDSATVAADALRSKFASLEIGLTGVSEITAMWTETASNGAKVQCRGMMDHLVAPRIYDVKSIRSASPDTCRRHIEEYGYDIQRAAYVSAVEHIVPDFAGRVEFIFVFCELEPPYDVTPIRLSGAFRELGERRWKRAVDIWERCLRTGVWPGYVDGIIEVDPSPWRLAKDMERQFLGNAANENDELPE